MNCAHALRMLDACVDDELDATTAAEVSAHVSTCPACANALVERQNLSMMLKAPALRHASPRGLRDEIVRDIGRTESPRAQLSAPRWWQALVFGATTAVAGVVGGWWLAQSPVTDSLPELAVGRHVESLTTSGPRIDVPSSDRHVIRPWFQGRAEFAPRVRDISAQGFELVGARLDRVGNRQAIVVVYRLREHIIDVYSWRKSQRSALGDRGATSKAIRGFNVVGWDDDDLEMFVVSDADTVETQRFVDAFRES